MAVKLFALLLLIVITRVPTYIYLEIIADGGKPSARLGSHH